MLAVRQPDGYVVVDKSGVGYQTKPVMPPEVLLAEVNPGDAPLLSEVAIVASAAEKLRGMVDRITAGNRDSIVLVLESGRTVTWGSSSDSELKAQVVTALLKRKPKSSIDVSSPHNPAVQYSDARCWHDRGGLPTSHCLPGLRSPADDALIEDRAKWRARPDRSHTHARNLNVYLSYSNRLCC